MGGLIWTYLIQAGASIGAHVVNLLNDGICMPIICNKILLPGPFQNNI